MSVWIFVWLLVAVLTTGAVAVCVAALARHVFVVGRAARELSDAVRPLADGIGDDAARASRRAGAIEPPGRRSVRGRG